MYLQLPFLILLPQINTLRLIKLGNRKTQVMIVNSPVSEFNEFEPRLKSAKNRFQSSTGLNIEILNTILSGTNHI